MIHVDLMDTFLFSVRQGENFLCGGPDQFQLSRRVCMNERVGGAL